MSDQPGVASYPISNLACNNKYILELKDPCSDYSKTQKNYFSIHIVSPLESLKIDENMIS